MGINQLNQDLNDAFETYFPSMNALARLPYGALTLAVASGLKARARLFGGRRLTNERIVEVPQILRWLPDEGTVLDIGCVSSRLPIQLASLGYTVHGVDTRPYPFTHPNFTFFHSDLFDWVAPHLYDSVCLISVIEHFGFGGYGDLVGADADRRAVDQISKTLVPGGSLFVSFPYGEARSGKTFRVYDDARVQSLFSGFDRVREAYFERVDGAWMPSSAASLAGVSSPGFPVNGVAILQMRKAGAIV